MTTGKTMKTVTTLLRKGLILLVLTLPVSTAIADLLPVSESPAVFSQQVDKPVSEIYDKLYESLEAARFYVVFEPDIGANLARFAEKWGEDYNRNKLSQIRSMVFCNGWYANQVSNLDPGMLGFCPLHITLIESEGRTTVLFNRPGVIAQNSPARDLLTKIESEVIAAIRQGVQ